MSIDCCDNGARFIHWDEGEQKHFMVVEDSEWDRYEEDVRIMSYVDDIHKMEDEKLVKEIDRVTKSIGKNTADDVDMEILNDIERKLSGGEHDNNKSEGKCEPVSKTDVEDSGGD